MAIKLPDPGNGIPEQKTGNDEWTNMQIVRENFADQSNAASRLVGKKHGNLAEIIGYTGVSGTGLAGATPHKDSDVADNGDRTTEIYRSLFQSPDATTFFHCSGGGLKNSLFKFGANLFIKAPTAFTAITANHTGNDAYIVTGYDANHPTVNLKERKLWNSLNTKLDTNGALSPSSPTIDLYSDRIETNDDGAKMNPEFVRNGVGDYTIKNTTGLRDEGWYIKIPNDMNGNPKVAVAIDTDKDGNLSIKTYKRTFSLETFTFDPDLSEPLDIPEGRWIDLRFNDLPEEQLDESIE